MPLEKWNALVAAVLCEQPLPCGLKDVRGGVDTVGSLVGVEPPPPYDGYKGVEIVWKAKTENILVRTLKKVTSRLFSGRRSDMGEGGYANLDAGRTRLNIQYGQLSDPLRIGALSGSTTVTRPAMDVSLNNPSVESIEIKRQQPDALDGISVDALDVSLRDPHGSVLSGLETGGYVSIDTVLRVSLGNTQIVRNELDPDTATISST